MLRMLLLLLLVLLVLLLRMLLVLHLGWQLGRHLRGDGRHLLQLRHLEVRHLRLRLRHHGRLGVQLLPAATGVVRRRKFRRREFDGFALDGEVNGWGVGSLGGEVRIQTQAGEPALEVKPALRSPFENRLLWLDRSYCELQGADTSYCAWGGAQ